MATEAQIKLAVEEFQGELDDLSGLCWVWDVESKTTCGQPATRYMRVGSGRDAVIEHICETHYRQDIVYPNAHPATQHDYEMYRESGDDDD